VRRSLARTVPRRAIVPPVAGGGWSAHLALFVCLLACAPLAALPALAQQRGPARAAPKAPEKEKEPAQPPEQPAPYDRDLMRLSEIIGSLAFLRGLCAAPDAGEWSSRMRALLDAEGITPGRRDRLAGAFNRGYRSYAVTYRICTPSAQEAASRFVAEGERLSQALAGRFGG
jgi:uncharacterized protein (TIGR02301 family)